MTVFSIGYLSAQELTLADIFTDNMVMQQKSHAPVWGTAKPGAKITVVTSWDNKTYSCVTGADDRWQIFVNTPGAGGPFTLSVKGDKTILIKNLFLGEVWLASGQSNMSMPLKGNYGQPVCGSTEAILSSENRNIHFINIPVMAAYKPLDHFKAEWQVASSATAGDCSAVAWFFADMLQKYLKVPIGIIHASYGGSNIEAWMPAEACRKNSDITIPPVSDETSEWINNVPTVLYNGMINPLKGYGIKGVIWYQGECNIWNVTKYVPFFSSMADEWRSLWKEGDFPFYFAQIAPYDYTDWNFFTPEFPEISAYIREAQLKCSSVVPNCGMAVLLDVGEPHMIHPSHKKEVGERLALLALSKTYDKKGFEAQSPEFDFMETDGNKITIHFKNQFNGLTSYGMPLKEFYIAGENHVFVPAEASLDEEKGTVTVFSKLVEKPLAVRYAFKNFVKAELFGTGGLPVSSFRTDDWK